MTLITRFTNVNGVTSTINDTWVNGTLINEGDKCVHAKIDAVVYNRIKLD